MDDDECLILLYIIPILQSYYYKLIYLSLFITNKIMITTIFHIKSINLCKIKMVYVKDINNLIEVSLKFDIIIYNA